MDTVREGVSVERHVLPHGEAAAYEAALDVLAQLVGLAANRISEEEAKPSPDAVEIERWRRRRDAWAARRRGLDPRASPAVHEVLDQDAAFLRSLIEAGRG